MSTNKKIRKKMLTGTFLVVFFFSGGCTSVPLDQDKSVSQAIPVSTDTELGAYAAQWQAEYGDKSGFLPLSDGIDALGVRLDLADKAQKTLDLQYFLMADDDAGTLIGDALFRAADRGVRIRFLLDDIFTTEKDSILQLLNDHPNIEVRLFNPISRRGIYYLNFFAHFSQANRRMHNKSFTVDNAVSVIGGRNIADEYFDLRKGAEFSDFDSIAFGPIAQKISSAFDLFWNSPLAIPVEDLSDNAVLTPAEFAERKANFSAKAKTGVSDIYKRALESNLLEDLTSGDQQLYPANAKVFMDNPDKLQNPAGSEYMELAAELSKVLENASQEILFLTPYYVPEDSGVEFTRKLVDKGVEVTVLTNSLASNNHVAVYSGYAGYRKQVLDAGINLYELRASAGEDIPSEEGSGKLTLHTKLILIDKRYLFVGSLNLDPRSFKINSEMGVLIDTQELTTLMSDAIHKIIPEMFYHIILNNDDKIEWRGTIDGKDLIENHAPETSRWQRFEAWFMKIAPVSQL